MFSSIQKSGKQAKYQAQNALMGSLARVVLPIITGYLEDNVEYSASFAVLLMLMSVSIAGTVLLYHEIVFFSSPVLASNAHFQADAEHNQMNTTTRVLSFALTGLACVVAMCNMFGWGLSGW